MEMTSVLPIVQIILSVLLMVAVLLQQSAASIGVLGGGDDGAVKNTRRGSDKFLLQTSIVLGILYAGSSVFALFI